MYPDIASEIIQFHVQTGAEAISGFYGHGKKWIGKRILKDGVALKLLPGLERSLPMTESTVKYLEARTIRYVYNDSVSKTITECCAKNWQKMKRKSTQLLPSDTI